MRSLIIQKLITVENPDSISLCFFDDSQQHSDIWKSANRRIVEHVKVYGLQKLLLIKNPIGEPPSTTHSTNAMHETND